MWASLIEKAFAKIHGCYENLGRGSIEQGLRCLTGAPLLKTPLEGLLSSAGEHGGRAVGEAIDTTVGDETAERRRQELWVKMQRYKAPTRGQASTSLKHSKWADKSQEQRRLIY